MAESLLNTPQPAAQDKTDENFPPVDFVSKVNKKGTRKFGELTPEQKSEKQKEKIHDGGGGVHWNEIGCKHS